MVPTSSHPPTEGYLGPESGPTLTLPERVFRLFTSPWEAFARPWPQNLWVLPLLFMLVVSTTQSILLRDLALETQIDRVSGMDISQAQKDAILDSIDSGSASATGLVTQTLLGVVFSIALWYLLPALLYLLGLSFGLGARLRYAEVLGVTMLTALLHGLRELLRLPIMLSNHTLHVYTGPAALADPEQRALLALLQRFDLFDIYRIFLLTIGFAAISGLSAKRTLIPVLSVWLLASVILVGVYLSPLRGYMP